MHGAKLAISPKQNEIKSRYKLSCFSGYLGVELNSRI